MKRLITVGLALTLVVGGGFLVLRPFSTNPVNAANYERIREGMTLEEVEAVLGGPAAAEEPDGPGRVSRRWESQGGFHPGGT